MHVLSLLFCLQSLPNSDIKAELYQLAVEVSSILSFGYYQLIFKFVCILIEVSLFSVMPGHKLKLANFANHIFHSTVFCRFCQGMDFVDMRWQTLQDW